MAQRLLHLRQARPAADGVTAVGVAQPMRGDTPGLRLAPARLAARFTMPGMARSVSLPSLLRLGNDRITARRRRH